VRNKIFYILIILFLLITIYSCDSVEPQIGDPVFIVDETNLSARLQPYGTNDFRIRVSYIITYLFWGQPGYVHKLTFLTNGFRNSINYRQSAASPIGVKFQKDSGFWLPDSLTDSDSLKIYINIDGVFKGSLKDSVVYTNFNWADSINIKVQR